jgi:hypothetical protein
VNNIIILLPVLFCIIIFFLKRNEFLYWFFAFSILLPSGLGFIVNNINFSFIRISSIIFPILLFISAKIDKTKIKYYSPFFILYLIILCFSIISSYTSRFDRELYEKYLLDDFFQTVGILYIFCYFHNKINPENAIKKLLTSIIYITFIIYFIGIIELIIHRNIFSLLGVDTLLNESYIGATYRDNIYRITSVFNESLFFGYYISIIFPLLLFANRILKKRTIVFYINIANIILSFPLLYYVNSRTSTFIFIFIIAFLITYKIWIEFLSKNPLVYFIILFGFSILAIYNFDKIFNFTNEIIGVNRQYSTDESLRERKGQLDYISFLLKNRNIFIGQGRVNTYLLIDSTFELTSLDSMFIRYFLESGIIPVFSFLIILLLPIYNLIMQIMKRTSELNYDIFVLASFFGYFIMSIFSSNQELRIIFFYLISLYIYLIHSNLNFKKI